MPDAPDATYAHGRALKAVVSHDGGSKRRHTVLGANATQCLLEIAIRRL